MLDLCFKNQHLAYTISENTIIVKRKSTCSGSNCTPPLQSAPIDIKGKITDDKGEPIAGVKCY